MNTKLLKGLRWDKRIVRTKSGKFIYQEFFHDGWVTINIYEPNNFKQALSMLHIQMEHKLKNMEGYRGKIVIP